MSMGNYKKRKHLLGMTISR